MSLSSRQSFEPVLEIPTAPSSGVRMRASLASDDHFLQRLARLNREQLELALVLHRHRALVRVILASARLPPPIRRLAISLGCPRSGPFLIVTRDAQFVTCLGRGMSAEPHPIISRRIVEVCVREYFSDATLDA